MNWESIARKYGIESEAAYRHVFMRHEHPLDDYGDSAAWVRMDDALEAIRIAEMNMSTKLVKMVKEGLNEGE